jgi:hypothetical protein
MVCAWQTAPPGAAQQAAQDFLLRIQLPSQRDQQPQVGRALITNPACTTILQHPAPAALRMHLVAAVHSNSLLAYLATAAAPAMQPKP